MKFGRYNLLLNPPSGSMGWGIYLIIVPVALIILLWAADGSQLSFAELVKGGPWVLDFLSRMLPPNWAFAEKLVTWADVIRKTFADGGCDEVISTRRLVHIVETFGIFGDKMKALSMCLNRFDDDTKASFLDLYTKVDGGATAEQILAPEPEPVVAEPANEQVPM